MAKSSLLLFRRGWRSVAPAPRFARAHPDLVVPGSRYYLLASVPFVVAFGVVPFSLYAHSGEEWAFTPELLLRLAGLGLVAFVATAVVLRVIAAGSGATTKALAIGLFCLGVLTLLAHAYAPIAIGPLDGGEAIINEPLSYTVLEGFLLAGATFVFYLLCRGRGLAIATLFVGGVWLAGLGYLVATLLPAEKADAEAPLAESNARALAAAKSCGMESNVYHIVLDGMATDALLEVANDEDWKEKFSGFDLFLNNISNYTSTNNSVPSYLTGKYYHSDDLVEWRWNSWVKSFQSLAERRFSIWMYAPWRGWKKKTPHVDVIRSNAGVYRERIGALEGEFYEFLVVWLTSLTPNALTREAMPVISNISDHLFTFLTATPRRDKERLKRHRRGDAAALGKTGFQQVASALLLGQVALDEPIREPSCQYVYVHALLPHEPFVVDGRCHYAGEARRRPEKITAKEAYLQQAECALRKVIEFLDLLKELNRYDAATIILHGDHGSWLPFRSAQDPSNAEVLGRPRAVLLARVQALLMIKRPRAQHRLDIVERPTQLVDILPTIFDVLGLELDPAEAHGRSVYASAASPREARFAFDPDDRHGLGLIEVRIDDPSDLVSSKLTVIGPPTDPVLWREEVRRATGTAAAAGEIERYSPPGR